MSYFWTLFPYPVVETSELRSQLSEALGMLARMHMRTHGAVTARMQGRFQEPLAAAKTQQEYDSYAMEFISKLSSLRQLLDNSKYQIQIGGRFPRQTYARLIDQLEIVFRCTRLALYASRSFLEVNNNVPASTWMKELQTAVWKDNDAELRTISAISICESAIANKRPLPPSLSVPESSSLLRDIQASPMELLSPRYALEPGYSSLAAVHAAAMKVTDGMNQLIELTKELVGEVRIDVGKAGTTVKRN